MNKRAIIVATILFILIIGAMFGYSSMKRAELSKQTDVPVVVTPRTDVEPVRVNAVHFFSVGKHTVVGDVMMPTPCDLLSATSTVAASAPEQASIVLTTVNNVKTCAQVLTLQRFRVDFSANKDVTIKAVLDGKDVILNLKDAEPGMKPEKLGDLFFKG